MKQRGWPYFKNDAPFHVRTPKTVLKKVLVGLVLFSFGAFVAYLLPFLMSFSGVSALWVHHPLLPILVRPPCEACK